MECHHLWVVLLHLVLTAPHLLATDQQAATQDRVTADQHHPPMLYHQASVPVHHRTHRWARPTDPPLVCLPEDSTAAPKPPSLLQDRTAQVVSLTVADTVDPAATPPTTPSTSSPAASATSPWAQAVTTDDGTAPTPASRLHRPSIINLHSSRMSFLRHSLPSTPRNTIFSKLLLFSAASNNLKLLTLQQTQRYYKAHFLFFTIHI